MFTSTTKAIAKVAVSLCLIWLLMSCAAPTPVPVEPTIAPAPTSEVIVVTLAPEPASEPAPSETPLTPDESVLMPFEDEPWQGDYDKLPSDLCPTEPDASDGDIEESVSPPLFENEPHKEENAWVQRGLYVNRQGEVFALVVYGFDNSGEFVKEYTSQIRVCFDKLAPLNDAVMPRGRPFEGSLEGTLETPGEEDMLITFEFVGDGFKGDSEWLRTKVNNETEFRRLSTQDDPDVFTSVMTSFINNPQISFVDFIYDPQIRAGSTHIYLDSGTAKSKATDVKKSYGNVKAKRCKHPSLGVRGVDPTSGYRVKGRAWYDYAFPPGKWVGGCDPW